jgi:arabinofuranan 3-O-arabinosyltransferase
MLALLLLRRPRAVAASLAPLREAPVRRWRLGPALGAGVAAALVLGFVFALRAGAVLGPLVFLVLWRGVSARALALASGAALLVAVPVLHLAVGLPDMGYQTNYAVVRIAEHWVAVAAVCALGAALWRTLSGRPRGPGS